MRPVAYGLVVPFAAALLLSGFAFSAWVVDASQSDRFGQRMTNTPLFVASTECRNTDRCDRMTGCAPPVRPPGPLAEALPDDRAHRLYVDNLRAFQLCRQLLRHPTSVDQAPIHLVGATGASAEAASFAEIASRWNGDFLWEPASASRDIITRFGDEARAVFGPIPDIDCSKEATRILPLEIDGNIVDLKPNPGSSGSLQFEHRDAAGNIVKWSTAIASCDKPSLAGNVTYCGMNSRISRKVSGAVEWVTLCRKSSPHLEIDPDPYWQKDNPTFARLGIIGFNRDSGEIVFFDGSKERPQFDWTRSFTPPGGRSYGDVGGRAAAATLYDPTFQIQCSACHDNKGPYVIAPHISQARIGYQGGAAGQSAAAFSLGSYIPKMRRDERLPFRVIGSDYTATYATELARAKTLDDPSGSCTECHTLTTQITGQRIAADAVGRAPLVTSPTWAQVVSLRAETLKLGEIDAHRTAWARRSGAGKIHPWMVPRDGSNVGEMGPEIGDNEWRQLSDCIWEAGGEECGYRPLFTACPVPGTQSGGDGSEPTDLSLSVLPLPRREAGVDRIVRLKWSYLNEYGHVPQRDDVRFNIAIRSTPIPLLEEAPRESDYPTVSETSGDDFDTAVGYVGTSGPTMIVGNLSYFGHKRFSDPTPSVTAREYRADLPARCNRRYLARILPKRFCFDQSGLRYAQRGQLIFADVKCD